MEARELRIGNLVNYNGTHKEIGEVTGIMTYITGHKNININNRVDISYSIKDIKPIPLTEEWLKKLGFNKVGGLYGIYNGYFELIYNEDHISLIVENQWLTTKVNTVHALQNLYYALTNEELTIKNQ